MNLVDEHRQRPGAVLDLVGPRERVSGRQDAVGVDARLAVQAVPHHRRHVEQHRLCAMNYYCTHWQLKTEMKRCSYYHRAGG